MGVPGALSDKINQKKCLKRWSARNIKHCKWQQAAEQMHTNVARTRRKPLTGFSAPELIRPVNTAQVFGLAGETSLILNAETRPNIQRYVSLPLIIVVLQEQDKSQCSFFFLTLFPEAKAEKQSALESNAAPSPARPPADVQTIGVFVVRDIYNRE